MHDLGEHRLRDLLEPERVFQLVHSDLPGDFPPLESLDARPNNLPRQPTPFLGREREVHEVVQLLRGDVRLLTLTGTGGSGKTRLALQAAAEVLDAFSDGVIVVPLASLAEALDLTRSGEFRLVAAEAVEGMAWVSVATGDASGAARMLGAAEAMRDETEGGMPPSRRRRLEATEVAVRETLGADPFAAAAAGRALGREAAAAEALALARGLVAGAV